MAVEKKMAKAVRKSMDLPALMDDKFTGNFAKMCKYAETNCWLSPTLQFHFKLMNECILAITRDLLFYMKRWLRTLKTLR